MALATRLADHLDADPSGYLGVAGGRRGVRAALLAEYHRPLELVERPEPEPVGAARRRRPDRRRGRLRDRPARDRRPDGARGTEAAGRARARERRLGARGRRRRHRRRQSATPSSSTRRTAAGSACLPARPRHALRAAPVHRADASTAASPTTSLVDERSLSRSRPGSSRWTSRRTRTRGSPPTTRSRSSAAPRSGKTAA